jgi:hypothetical protein
MALSFTITSPIFRDLDLPTRACRQLYADGFVASEAKRVSGSSVLPPAI